MAISNTVNANVVLTFDDQFSGPACRAFEKFKKCAEETLKSLTNNDFLAMEEAFDQKKGLGGGFENLCESLSNLNGELKDLEKLKDPIGDFFRDLNDSFDNTSLFEKSVGIATLIGTLGAMAYFSRELLAFGLALGIMLAAMKLVYELEKMIGKDETLSNHLKETEQNLDVVDGKWMKYAETLQKLKSHFESQKALEQFSFIENINTEVQLNGGEQFTSNLQEMESAAGFSVDGIADQFRRLRPPVYDVIVASKLMRDEFTITLEKVAPSVSSMVNGIGNHFSRLDGLMVHPAREATSMITDSFSIMGDNVARSIDDLIFKGETRFESFRDFAYRTLIDIQEALLQTATGGQSIGRLIVDGLGGIFNTGSIPPTGGGIIDPGNIVLTDTGLGINKFAHGGAFNVGGSGGTDSELVRFMATPGERVSVETPEQQKQKVGGGVTINMDLRGSNGSEEIVKTIDKAFKKAIPFILDNAVWKVQDKYNREPRYLR